MRGAILRHGLVLDASRRGDVIHANGAPSPPERFAGGPDRAGGGDFRLPRWRDGMASRHVRSSVGTVR